MIYNIISISASPTKWNPYIRDLQSTNTCVRILFYFIGSTVLSGNPSKGFRTLKHNS